MKGGLAAALAALARVARERRQACAAASRCTRWWPRRMAAPGRWRRSLRGHGGDGAISMEPTELMLAPAHAGALTFRIRVPGLSAHGCVREEGVSAIETIPAAARRAARARSRAQRTAAPAALRSLSAAVRALDRQGSVQATGPRLCPICSSAKGVTASHPARMSAPRKSRSSGPIAGAARAHPFLADHPPVVEWWGGQFLPAQTPDERRDHRHRTTRRITDVTGAAADRRSHDLRRRHAAARQRRRTFRRCSSAPATSAARIGPMNSCRSTI